MIIFLGLICSYKNDLNKAILQLLIIIILKNLIKFMESRQKESRNQELTSTFQITSDLHDFSFNDQQSGKWITKELPKNQMRTSSPCALNRVKSESILRRKGSEEFLTKNCDLLENRQTLPRKKISLVPKEKSESNHLNRKVVSDPNIMKNYQKLLEVDISEKRKKLSQRKKQKISFINDKINKLKNINDKLNELKTEIMTNLLKESASKPEPKGQYYLGNLVQHLKNSNAVSHNSIEIQHFSKNFKILRELEKEHHLLTRPPACQKTLKQPSFVLQTLPTLVLDLDQTLVFTSKTDKVVATNTIYLKDKNGDRNVRHQVKLRPFVHKFLEEASKMYEIIIFTAGSSEYVNQAMRFLDPQRKFISRILTKEHTTKISGKFQVQIKDLRVLNTNLNRTVFVDNNMFSYALQLENGIPILPFYGDDSDTQLEQLLEYLKDLHNYMDIAGRNNEIFRTSELVSYFSKNVSSKEVIRSLYSKDSFGQENHIQNA